MNPDSQILEQMQQLRSEARAFVLATVVRSKPPSSAKAGAKALVLEDGSMCGWIGGGCAQPTVQRIAKRALAEGRPYLVRLTPEGQAVEEESFLELAMSCASQGSLEIFVEPILPQAALLVFGASPVAQAIPPLASRVGFSVTLACPGIGRVMLPDAAGVVDGWAAPAGVRPQFLVIATQGSGDDAALQAALDLRPSYLAMVASAKKADKLKERMLKAGHDRAAIEAIVAPAGVEIGAVSPEEIALAVVAGLVRARHNQVARLPPVSAAATPAAPLVTAACCSKAPVS